MLDHRRLCTSMRSYGFAGMEDCTAYTPCQNLVLLRYLTCAHAAHCAAA